MFRPSISSKVEGCIPVCILALTPSSPAHSRSSCRYPRCNRDATFVVPRLSAGYTGSYGLARYCRQRPWQNRPPNIPRVVHDVARRRRDARKPDPPFGTDHLGKRRQAVPRAAPKRIHDARHAPLRLGEQAPGLRPSAHIPRHRGRGAQPARVCGPHQFIVGSFFFSFFALKRIRRNVDRIGLSSVSSCAPRRFVQHLDPRERRVLLWVWGYRFGGSGELV